jgi:hypothetical protein
MKKGNFRILYPTIIYLGHEKVHPGITGSRQAGYNQGDHISVKQADMDCEKTEFNVLCLIPLHHAHYIF